MNLFCDSWPSSWAKKLYYFVKTQVIKQILRRSFLYFKISVLCLAAYLQIKFKFLLETEIVRSGYIKYINSRILLNIFYRTNNIIRGKQEKTLNYCLFFVITADSAILKRDAAVAIYIFPFFLFSRRKKINTIKFSRCFVFKTGLLEKKSIFQFDIYFLYYNLFYSIVFPTFLK